MRESFLRARSPEPRGLPHLGLSATQIYPHGKNFLPVLGEATAEKLRNLKLGPAVPVASIGTCFAEEFAAYMRARGYNYVSTEPDVFHASANWGRVYTIPNLHQIVRYSFEQGYPLLVEQSAKGWFDPLREFTGRTVATREEAVAAIERHRKASHDAFAAASVLILTVGQNEAWVETPSGVVWGQMPPGETLRAAGRSFEAREFGYAANLAGLASALEILFRARPQLQVLMTVSPVASYATFCDTDVVSQSLANKCLLRVVVRDVVRRYPGRVFYFPSFEIALGMNEGNFRADNRHVKHATVDGIFDTLVRATRLED
jgi:hypothetical protein